MEHYMKKENFVRKPNLEFEGLKISQGNSKLLSNEAISFLVWNITSRITCPYATESCLKSCYAYKSERMYSNTLKRNESNLALTKQDDFVNNMIKFLELQLDKKSNAGKQIVYRIHESGDFYNLNYLSKWIEIANYFKGNDRLIFQAYTKSILFIVEYLDKHNITLQDVNIHFTYSIWNDTNEQHIETARNLQLQTYEAFPKKQMFDKVATEGYFECECINCGKCLECYKTKHMKVAVAIH